VSVRGNQVKGGGHIVVAGNVFKAVLAATALALMSAWLALPSVAVAQTQFPLTVTLAGGGTGSVHDTNFNITCPSDCSAAFDQGSEVVLVASPDSGSTFMGWSGAGCSGTQSCIVTMNADQAVTATFLQPGRGTLTAPVPKTRRHRQIRAKITMGWRWNAHRTVLTRLSFANLPATARILVACTGKRCPFKTRKGTARRIKAFEHGLVGSAFLSGDKLMLTISARGRRAERAQVTIRHERLPRAQLLG
jgi:Divergent InlB B-repeat domain